MVTIPNTEHFKDAVRFARLHPCEDTRRSFKRCLTTLNRLKRNMQCELRLVPDFVKHSFIFYLNTTEDGRTRLHGGMILHGYQETFSVSVTNSRNPYWSIHT